MLHISIAENRFPLGQCMKIALSTVSCYLSAFFTKMLDSNLGPMSDMQPTSHPVLVFRTKSIPSGTEEDVGAYMTYVGRV